MRKIRLKTFAKCLMLVCGALFGLVAFSFSQSKNSIKKVDYPEGYRRWIHVKSEVIGPDSQLFKAVGGIHHIYANAQAMKGFTTGRFPDGSVLVFDVIETQTKDGVTTEGVRRFIDVMQKDAKGFAQTGGWGFEEFRGNSRTERVLNETAKTGCFTCHTKQKEQDFVFSAFRQ